MKCHQFWVISHKFITINGKSEAIRLLVGSDVSKEDASAKADSLARKIESRISSGSKIEEYEHEIKEYVYNILDHNNIITINRYGALVLNTTEYTILDLDDYPFEFMDIFRSFKGKSKKDRIVERFKKRIKKLPELGSSFRIYETCKGIRVIGKKYFSPRENLFTKHMRFLFVDWLYLILSQKQDCYRARLTPKPFRMRFRTIKIRSPLDCENDDFRIWMEEYIHEAKKYSVLKYRESIGSDFSNDEVIKYHDRVSNLNKGLKLA